MTTVSLARPLDAQPVAGTCGARNCRCGHGECGYVVVGAQLIGVTPPSSAATYASTTGSTMPPADTAPYCPGAYQCLQPGADPLVPYGRDPLVPFGPATWNP